MADRLRSKSDSCPGALAGPSAPQVPGLAAKTAAVTERRSTESCRIREKANCQRAGAVVESVAAVGVCASSESSFALARR